MNLSSNPMDLTGKTILVTGASSGIGRQTAITISKLGARVICVARNEGRLKDTLSALEGDGHQYYPIDLSNLAAIEPFIKSITPPRCSMALYTAQEMLSHVHYN